MGQCSDKIARFAGRFLEPADDLTALAPIRQMVQLKCGSTGPGAGSETALVCDPAR